MNKLYPIFLKAGSLNILIVGGGNVALEKLTYLLKSSPDANVVMVAPEFNSKTIELAEKFQVPMAEGVYDKNYLNEKHIVVVATDNESVNIQVYNDCKELNILVNVADNPLYCDFYMGGIVTKGDVKIAISTNGKSPTTAKRLRQYFEEILPDNIDDLVNYLNKYRKTIKGNFEEKVNKLNKITQELIH